MVSTVEIPDSTDWLDTPLKDFSPLENALHCQICKEFYETPMITSCAHTFCSKCIRTCLSADGRCPTCRASDQASKLRNNWVLEEVVNAFLAARPAALNVARSEQELMAQAKRPGKRKRDAINTDSEEQMESDGRATRRKSRRATASQASRTETIELSETDEFDEYKPEQPDDGLVECPLGCGKRMKIEQVDPHLDRCEDERKQASRAKSRTPLNGFRSSRGSSQQKAKPQERLAELNYSLLKDQAMRKKLDELGIPTWGPKQLMIKRHTEWVNLWNANCDSKSPRTKRELLQDLDTWERTQGGRASVAHGPADSIMRKDFDGIDWASKNKDEFSRLITDAKRKKTTPAPASNRGEEDSTPIVNENESSGPRVPLSPSQSVALQPKSEVLQPYTQHPEALQPVREKAEHMEPIINEGFRSREHDAEYASLQTNGSSTEQATSGPMKSSEPAPRAENTAVLALDHSGQVLGTSGDEDVSQKRTGSPCDLPHSLAI